MHTFAVAMAILFSATLYLYHGRRGTFSALVQGLELGIDPLEWGGVFQCAAAVLLLLAPALLLTRLVLKVPWSQMGFTIGDWKTGLKICVPFILVAVPAIVLTQRAGEGLCTFYPLSPFAARSVGLFLAWQASYLVYYVAWEGAFRGVIQLGMGPRLGLMQAMLFQTAITTLLHAGHPEIETLGALVAGPFFGWVAIRTRSIWYVLAMHAAAGLATDLGCILA
jgi:uncharacterized protein